MTRLVAAGLVIALVAALIAGALHGPPDHDRPDCATSPHAACHPRPTPRSTP